MQYRRSLSFCAWAVLVGCGGATVEPGGSGGETSAGGASSGGAQPASGGKQSTGGDASTGGRSGGGGGTTGSGGTKATGGVSSGGVAIGGGNSGGVSTGGTPPGCEPIPTTPVYGCKIRPFQEGDCYPWVETDFTADRVLGGYEQGCQVTLPRPDGFSQCGPQLCTCEAIPSPKGGSYVSSWLCPL